MKKLFVIAALATASLAHAEFYSGNELLAKLDDPDTFNQGLAHGYIVGVSDAISGVRFCPQTGVSAKQVKDIVRKWLYNNPGQRHLSADWAVSLSLSSTFPCAAKQPTSSQYPL